MNRIKYCLYPSKGDTAKLMCLSVLDKEMWPLCLSVFVKKEFNVDFLLSVWSIPAQCLSVTGEKDTTFVPFSKLMIFHVPFWTVKEG